VRWRRGGRRYSAAGRALVQVARVQGRAAARRGREERGATDKAVNSAGSVQRACAGAKHGDPSSAVRVRACAELGDGQRVSDCRGDRRPLQQAAQTWCLRAALQACVSSRPHDRSMVRDEHAGRAADADSRRIPSEAPYRCQHDVTSNAMARARSCAIAADGATSLGRLARQSACSRGKRSAG
jgi:hypothetical protein